MRFLYGLVFLCAFILPTDAKERSTAREVDMESFQMVWETIRDKHWDLEGSGVDWDSVYQKYLPKAQVAFSRAEMRKVIQKMIGELGQSHFNILGQSTSDAMAAVEALAPGGKGRPGFTVSPVDGQVFISTMDREGPAAKAGLKIGDEIVMVRDKAIKKILEKANEAYGDSPHAPLYINRALNRFFHGDSGEKVTLTINRAGRKSLEKSLEIAAPKGQYVSLLNLPSTYYQYDSDILPDNIGFVRFNIWVPQVKQAFEAQSLPAMKNTKGMIIDLRGNGGGLGVLAISLANKLVKEKGLRLGTMRNGGTEMNFPVFPQAPVYEGKVAILIDEGSASTSEIFAAGMQEIGRAKVFGVRSAGATLPSLIEPLPNGDLFQYAMADYISFKGKKLEGAGVTPDQLTPHTRESLKRGEDAALHAAKTWILN